MIKNPDLKTVNQDLVIDSSQVNAIDAALEGGSIQQEINQNNLTKINSKADQSALDVTNEAVATNTAAIDLKANQADLDLTNEAVATNAANIDAKANSVDVYTKDYINNNYATKSLLNIETTFLSGEKVSEVNYSSGGISNYNETNIKVGSASGKSIGLTESLFNYNQLMIAVFKDEDSTELKRKWIIILTSTIVVEENPKPYNTSLIDDQITNYLLFDTELSIHSFGEYSISQIYGIFKK